MKPDFTDPAVLERVRRAVRAIIFDKAPLDDVWRMLEAFGMNEQQIGVVLSGINAEWAATRRANRAMIDAIEEAGMLGAVAPDNDNTDDEEEA